MKKSFKNFKAVDDLSFSIQGGDVYGFLGQNGAGKSTTIRMLLGLIYPDGGNIYIKGEHFTNSHRHLLQYIGAIIERPDLYGYLSGWDNLKMLASLSHKKIPEARLHEVLELVGLKGREQDKVKAYSQGMKQRLGIAIALVHDPELLILDEPTNGLDPQGIVEMRELILNLSRNYGKTILISSHLLNEIEQIATRMIIIHKGKKIVEGNVSELLKPEESLTEIKLLNNSPLFIDENPMRSYIVNNSANSITYKMHTQKIPEVTRWLVSQGADITGIETKHSLEAYFISLTNDSITKN